MKVSEFFKSLDSISDDCNILFKSPDCKLLPLHFHVTEAATVFKKFKDCGGIDREESYASIQLWTANDYNHRITTGKLRNIILNTLMENEKDMEMIIEHEADTLSLYTVERYEVISKTILFILGKKKAQCLAPDQCGINEEKNSCTVERREEKVEKKCCKKGGCC
mgnify:CR=1 FL=1